MVLSNRDKVILIIFLIAIIYIAYEILYKNKEQFDLIETILLPIPRTHGTIYSLSSLFYSSNLNEFLSEIKFINREYLFNNSDIIISMQNKILNYLNNFIPQSDNISLGEDIKEGRSFSSIIANLNPKSNPKFQYSQLDIINNNNKTYIISYSIDLYNNLHTARVLIYNNVTLNFRHILNDGLIFEIKDKNNDNVIAQVKTNYVGKDNEGEIYKLNITDDGEYLLFESYDSNNIRIRDEFVYLSNLNTEKSNYIVEEKNINMRLDVNGKKFMFTDKTTISNILNNDNNDIDNMYSKIMYDLLYTDFISMFKIYKLKINEPTAVSIDELNLFTTRNVKSKPTNYSPIEGEGIGTIFSYESAPDLKYYSFTTSSDSSIFDPKSWEIYGKKSENDEFILLSKVDNYEMPDGRLVESDIFRMTMFEDELQIYQQRLQQIQQIILQQQEQEKIEQQEQQQEQQPPEQEKEQQEQEKEQQEQEKEFEITNNVIYALVGSSIIFFIISVIIFMFLLKKNKTK